VQKTEGCWLWLASTNKAGYGLLGNRRGSHLAHRVSFEIHNGPIPEGMSIDHICLNTSCVRPDHLRLATHAKNNQNRNGATRKSLSGVRGVRRYRDTERWVARGQIDRKGHHIGYFGSIEEADAAATAWRRKHMPYSEMDK
jgi:hypothetical protein